MNRIRVLIVDDSAFMRRVVREMLESDPAIEVIGAAKDGREGVEMVLEYSPDVVTMDIEMPRMNGLEAIEVIMERSPRPILVLSSITTEGAKVTLDALDKGAADYVTKTISRSVIDIIKVKTELVEKVKAVARRGRMLVRPRIVKHSPVHIPRPTSGSRKADIVVIGASTGGPKALQEILPRIPGGMTTTFVVAVHMPMAFTKAFAERMDALCALKVKEAEGGEALKSGHIFITPGGMQTRIRRRSAGVFGVEISDEPKDVLYKPCIDITMTSAAEAFLSRTVGVILTGMGRDGMNGMRVIKQKGGTTIAQSEDTCTVYGMPKAVVDAALADKVVSLDEMAEEIVKVAC